MGSAKELPSLNWLDSFSLELRPLRMKGFLFHTFLSTIIRSLLSFSIPRLHTPAACSSWLAAGHWPRPFATLRYDSDPKSSDTLLKLGLTIRDQQNKPTRCAAVQQRRNLSIHEYLSANLLKSVWCIECFDTVCADWHSTALAFPLVSLPSPPKKPKPLRRS